MQHVHMVAATAPDADAEALPLVCLHGYGSGVGMYYSSLPPLAEAWPGPVYVLDTPGCGQSSRPPWLKRGLDCPVDELTWHEAAAF